jgi:hypothetical protein
MTARLPPYVTFAQQYCLRYVRYGRGGTATGGRNLANSVKEYRFVKTRPSKTGGNHSQSGKPSHYPARTHLPALPRPGIPRIPGMNTGISRVVDPRTGEFVGGSSGMQAGH